MTEEINQPLPEYYLEIDKATKEMGFTMPSDMLTCSLLKTLAGSKPSGHFLELGTGTGLSTSWILDGMDSSSNLISLDHDESLLAIAGKYLLLDETLDMLTKGGLYIIDDMLPQPNWPDGHHEKAVHLVQYLEGRTDLLVTKLNWATGIVIATKRG